MKLSVVSVMVLSALSSVFTVAHAQEQSNQVNLDEVVVTGTREAKSLKDVAGNTGKVTKEDIDLVNPDHAQDMINRISGVNIQTGSGQESLISIRSPVLTGGGAGSNFLLMEDGIPLRSPGFSNVNGLAEPDYEWADSIEVVRGPGSALYGSNAMYGLVNVLTLAPSQTLERSLDFTIGSDDLYKTKGTFSNTDGNNGYRASFATSNYGGWRDNTGYDQQKITIRDDLKISSTDTLQTVLSAFNLNQQTGGYYTTTDKNAYKNESLMKNNQFPNAFRDWHSVRLYSRWTHELENGDKLVITPYVRHNEMEFSEHYLPSNATQENGHDSFGLQNAYYLNLKGNNKAIFGLDLEYTNGFVKDTQDKASYSYFGKNRQQGVHYDYGVVATTVAPYVHTEWQLTKRLRSTIGLRFEHVQYDYDNHVASGTGMADGSPCFAGSECLYYRPADRKDTFNNWSPKFGLTYQLTKDKNLFLSLRQGYHAPAVSDLYSLQNQQQVGEIDSEKLDSIEVGSRGHMNIVKYEVNLYYMKDKNYFFRDAKGLNVTNGKTLHKGVELALGMPIGENFDISGNYTYAIHTYDFNNAASGVKSGNDIDTAPRNIANVRLGWDINLDSRAELEWQHVGHYYLDPSNDHKYDGHDVLNLRASSHVTKDLTVHAAVENLADTHYAYRADYAFGTYRFFPAPGRTFEVGAGYSF